MPASSYFDREIELYKGVIDIIDNKISKGKDLESVKKDLYKKIEHLEYLKNYD